MIQDLLRDIRIFTLNFLIGLMNALSEWNSFIYRGLTVLIKLYEKAVTEGCMLNENFDIRK